MSFVTDTTIRDASGVKILSLNVHRKLYGFCTSRNKLNIKQSQTEKAYRENLNGGNFGPS